VTIAANRGDRQPLLKQSLAVYAERVMGEDTVLGDIIGAGDLGPLFVTSSTDKGNVGPGHFGVRRLHREDIVGSVTVPATWRQFGTGFHGLAVKASSVDFRDLAVADPAIDRLHLLPMREFNLGQVSVTGDTLEFAVNRLEKCFSVDEERYLAPIVTHRQLGVLVAHQAVFY